MDFLVCQNAVKLMSLKISSRNLVEINNNKKKAFGQILRYTHKTKIKYLG